MARRIFLLGTLLVCASAPLACLDTPEVFPGPGPRATSSVPTSTTTAKADAATPPRVSVPFAGEWAPLPGVGEQCGVRMAKDPAALLPAFDWEPCNEAGLGCQRLRIPRVGTSGFDDFGLGIRQGVHVDAGGVHLAVQRTAERGYLRTIHTVGQRGLFAFYFDEKQGCVADATVTAAGIALFASTTGAGAAAEQLQRHLLRSRYEAPLSLSTIDMSARIQGGLGYGVGIVGDGFVGYVLQREVGLFGVGPTSTVASAPRRNEMPLIVKGGIVTSDELDTALDFYPVTGETPRRIASASQGAALGRLAVDPDGDTITFIEQPALVEGPLLYALSLEPISTKRAVTHLSPLVAFPSASLTHDGLFAHTDKEGRIVVVRLSDGRSWPAISTSDGRGFRQLVYVDKTSAWGIVWAQGGGAAIERHTLGGEPTIPPF